MVGAAVRKPRVPNDKLHRVTDNRLAEADRINKQVCVTAASGFRSLTVTLMNFDSSRTAVELKSYRSCNHCITTKYTVNFRQKA